MERSRKEDPRSSLRLCGEGHEIFYNAMRVMITALPNLQKLTIANFGHRHKYFDGEDPDEEEAARTANYTTHDINIISLQNCLREVRFVATNQGTNNVQPK